MKTWTLIAALLTAVPAVAQDIDCRNAMTQRDINICAGRGYQAADGELNQIYRELLAAQRGDAERLRVAQRTWIAYRDSECSYQTRWSEGGSIHPAEYTSCLITLTRARTRQLQNALECTKNLEKC